MKFRLLDTHDKNTNSILWWIIQEKKDSREI